MNYVRKLYMSKSVNMRDIGGYPVSYGSCTTWGSFYRSDAPIEVSERDIRTLRERKVFTVIDMRNEEETQRTPCALHDIEGFEYHNIPMYGDGRLPMDPKDMGKTYFEMVDERNVCAKIFKVMLEAKDAVLFHCLAGKDRTGVVAALLLDLAGASKEDIIADYILTSVYLAPIRDKFKREFPDIPDHFLIPQKEFMSDFLALFWDKYASAENYLSDIGFSGNDITELKQRLITKF